MAEDKYTEEEYLHRFFTPL